MQVNYANVHWWLRETFGKPNECENKACSRIAHCFDWALIKDKKYELKRENFMRLCRSCHKKYDYTDEYRLKISIARKIDGRGRSLKKLTYA